MIFALLFYRLLSFRFWSIFLVPKITYGFIWLLTINMMDKCVCFILWKKNDSRFSCLFSSATYKRLSDSIKLNADRYNLMLNKDINNCYAHYYSFYRRLDLFLCNFMIILLLHKQKFPSNEAMDNFKRLH